MFLQKKIDFKDRAFHINNLCQDQISEEVRLLLFGKFKQLTELCFNRNLCRQILIAKHFGETSLPCAQCDNCIDFNPLVLNTTSEAILVFNALFELNQITYNKVTCNELVMTLMGSDSNFIKDKKLNKCIFMANWNLTL